MPVNISRVLESAKGCGGNNVKANVVDRRLHGPQSNDQGKECNEQLVRNGARARGCNKEPRLGISAQPIRQNNHVCWGTLQTRKHGYKDF